ncbi:CPBP family intramembrane metalloprotease [Candidatus Micrarchaeota archaeon]|nr:CPBP family intramembrane metalloprotease [Candidatus Micrarchaeota archaeon]
MEKKKKKDSLREIFSKTNRNIFLVLLAGSIIGFLGVIPLALSIQSQTGALENLPLPLDQLIVIQLIQGIIQNSILIALGLFYAKKVGLTLPLLEKWFAGSKTNVTLASVLPISVGLGILTGALIIALGPIFEFIEPTVLLINIPTPETAALDGFLASFYGGINEEILLRLFLMTIIVNWLYQFRKESKPTDSTMWLSIFIAALLFGLGHLPTAFAIFKMTPIYVIRIILLNAVAGLVFGWLYWKKGFESAMIGHFSTDIVLHVLSQLITI